MTPGEPGQLEIALLSWSGFRELESQLTGKVPGHPLADKTAAKIELAAFYAHQKVVQEQQMLDERITQEGSKVHGSFAVFRPVSHFKSTD